MSGGSKVIVLMKLWIKKYSMIRKETLLNEIIKWIEDGLKCRVDKKRPPALRRRRRKSVNFPGLLKLRAAEGAFKF